MEKTFSVTPLRIFFNGKNGILMTFPRRMGLTVLLGVVFDLNEIIDHGPRV